MNETTKKRTILDVITGVVENKIAPPLMKISQIRYLESLQKTFMALMTYMILGATVTLILNLGGLFGESGLNLPAVESAINAVIAPCRNWLVQICFVTLNLLALIATTLNGYYLGEYYHAKDSEVDPFAAAIMSMVSFLCFIDFAELSANFDWPSYILGSPSLMGGLVIGILAVELYRILIGKRITIKMPESVPPMIAAAFTNMIPISAVVLLFGLVGQGIASFDFLAMLNQVAAYLVVGGSGPVAQFIGFLVDRLLWFIGLHGSNIVSSVMNPIWTSMITDNINAFSAGEAIPYMFTQEWINFYVRCSVFPIALMCAMSKVKRFKVLGKLSLPGTIFNIAEPVMYGLPVVLNPLMFVPWVLGFAVLFIFNAALAMLGLTPPMVAMVVWTMPFPLAALIGSGFKLSALLISLMNMVLIFLMFLPFFKVMEKQELEEGKKLEAQMNGEQQSAE